MRLSVDWTRCDGHGLCAQLYPRAITVDDWGYPLIQIPVVGADDMIDARRAVAFCPALALRLEHVPVEPVKGRWT
jgi:ferredoxin